MLTQTAIDNAKTTIKTLLANQYPTLDLRRGTVMNELLVNLAALGYATIAGDLATFKAQLHLQDWRADPNAVDPALVDATLGNFFITRKAGSYAKGLVAVLVNDNKRYLIPAGAVITTGDLEFTTTVTVDTSDPTQPLVQLGDGVYQVVLPVTASAVGSTQLLTAGTAMTTTVFGGNFIAASAYNDFYDGSASETNAELLARVPTVLGTRDLTSVQSITTRLHDEFPELRQVTVLGYNDREVQRDVNNLGVKVGGKIDVYVQTALTPLQERYQVTTDTNGDYTFDTAATVPILRIASVTRVNDPLTSLTYTVTSGVAPTAPQLSNTTAGWYRYSSYETVTVHTGLPTTALAITVDYYPGIQNLQAFVSSSDQRCKCSDTLIKTYLPCFLDLAVDYYAPSTDAAVEAAVIDDLLNYINLLPTTTLYISKLIDLIHNRSLTGLALPVTVTGTLYQPDGTLVTVTSDNVLTVPENLSLGVSNRTVKLIVTPSTIRLSRIGG